MATAELSIARKSQRRVASHAALRAKVIFMKPKENNYAFIDSQNLNLGIQKMGWKLDYRRFRVYLKEKYGAKKVYLFIGYIPRHASLYHSLENFGYSLVFKPIVETHDGQVKGNIDAELVLQAMIEYQNY